MSRSAVARLEAVCARAVERTFAIAFPVELAPVQIARKLVTAYEDDAASPGAGTARRRFAVLLSPADAQRLRADGGYHERAWTAMLDGLARRAALPARSLEVVIRADRAVTRGTVSIAVERLAEPERLAVRVRRGFPAGAALALARGTVVVGRDAACDLALVDPGVSRRHLAIDCDARPPYFRDLGSSNGTRLNGALAAAGALAAGDVLGLGGSELEIAAAAP